MLAQGRSRTALSKDDGTPTKAGLFWENLTGQSLPESGLMSKTQFRENNTEYITLNGKKRATRHLDVTTGEWVFSRLGLKFYRNMRRSYIVNVPVTVHGTPADGRHYTKSSTIPISKLGIASPTIALEPRLQTRMEKVKQLVMQQLPSEGPIYNLAMNPTLSTIRASGTSWRRPW